MTREKEERPSGGCGGDGTIYTADHPDPNPYTGPHKWVLQTAGHPFSECMNCGAVKIDPGPGDPDPPPVRTPSGDWYAPHEPETCEPKRVTVLEVYGTCGKFDEVVEALGRAGYEVDTNWTRSVDGPHDWGPWNTVAPGAPHRMCLQCDAIQWLQMPGTKIEHVQSRDGGWTYPHAPASCVAPARPESHVQVSEPAKAPEKDGDEPIEWTDPPETLTRTRVEKTDITAPWLCDLIRRARNDLRLAKENAITGTAQDLRLVRARLQEAYLVLLELVGKDSPNVLLRGTVLVPMAMEPEEITFRISRIDRRLQVTAERLLDQPKDPAPVVAGQSVLDLAVFGIRDAHRNLESLLSNLGSSGDDSC